ncbi:MAG TPA: KpsF/GutQ family sugar-phosphate isomerase [Saprospiraceae bacterium]|nr:KpsF/GutQ family sugar-phosphate isomerase [Saprospiraceae bacterium]HMQ83737.1 KpsF/GutQ family sugar-phosphate isomerase [Saprospiraceae bacterium]
MSTTESFYTRIAQNVFDIESKAIAQLSQQLTADFDQAIECILQIQGGRLVISGIGKSGHIGVKIAATLSSTGTPSFFMHPAEAIHGDLGMLQKEDVIMLISNSGETEEILKLIPSIKRLGIPMIALCGRSNSTLVRNADFFLNIYVDKEACPLALAPTSSTTATLAMGDALAIALMEARKFLPENFAVFHPGGSLGKKLLTRVKDVMRKDDLPFLPKAASSNELVIKLSEGKIGMVIIGNSQQVEGIITDGDLRRALQKKPFHEIVVAEIMTPNPIIVQEDLKLSEVEPIMMQKKITTLLVKDSQERLSGVLQVYDLNI